MEEVIWTDGIIKQHESQGFYKTASPEEIIDNINKIIEMETKIENRTGVDFTKHELIVTEQEGLLVHRLKHPEYTHMNSVTFINTNGIMAVTGDYGNWIFCREFHPSADGRVCNWIEKLHYASSQEGYEFDSEGTREEIQRGLDGGLEEYGYIGEDLKEVKEYYENLLNFYVDCSQWEYEAYAYSNIPSFMCSEDVPNVKKVKVWLKIVFDAFDEICRRMKEEKDGK